MTTDLDVDEFLEHHGVKGQKWGIRNFLKNRERNRELNRRSKERDKARQTAEFNRVRKALRPTGRVNFNKDQRRADIDRARARISTGALKADKKALKTQYKLNKAKLGRREARRIFKAKRKVLYKDIERSQEIRDGKELTSHILDVMATSIQESHVRQERARRIASISNPHVSQPTRRF